MNLKAVEMDYTNWRGERKWRKILPSEIVWASSEWHPQDQWFLLAWDFEKEADREFALSGIHGFRTNTEKETP